jgi:hypothetical protein
MNGTGEPSPAPSVCEAAKSTGSEQGCDFYAVAPQPYAGSDIPPHLLCRDGGQHQGSGGASGNGGAGSGTGGSSTMGGTGGVGQSDARADEPDTSDASTDSGGARAPMAAAPTTRTPVYLNSRRPCSATVA